MTRKKVYGNFCRSVVICGEEISFGRTTWIGFINISTKSLCIILCGC